MPIPSPNPMFDLLYEYSHREDSNKWSNVEFSEEIMQLMLRILSGARGRVLELLIKMLVSRKF